jgi:hypothetical protein
MMMKTTFELETERLGKLLDQLTDRLAKFTGGDLRKRVSSTPAAELMAELSNLVALLGEANAVVKRRGAALPEFRRWALGQHTPRFMVAEKAIGHDGSDAQLSELFPPNAPTIDPTAAVGDTELRHRFNQTRGDY